MQCCCYYHMSISFLLRMMSGARRRSHASAVGGRCYHCACACAYLHVDSSLYEVEGLWDDESVVKRGGCSLQYFEDEETKSNVRYPRPLSLPSNACTRACGWHSCSWQVHEDGRRATGDRRQALDLASSKAKSSKPSERNLNLPCLGIDVR